MSKKGYIYFLDDHNGHIKIGITDNIERRMKQLQTGNALELSLVHYIRVNSMHDAFELEALLHHALNNYKVKNEWYEKYAVMKFLKHNTIQLGQYRFHGIGFSYWKIAAFTAVMIVIIFVLNYFETLIIIVLHSHLI